MHPTRRQYNADIFAIKNAVRDNAKFISIYHMIRYDTFNDDGYILIN